MARLCKAGGCPWLLTLFSYYLSPLSSQSGLGKANRARDRQKATPSWPLLVLHGRVGQGCLPWCATGLLWIWARAARVSKAFTLC